MLLQNISGNDRKRGALAGSANAAPILEVEDNVADNQTIPAPPGSEEYIRQKKNVEGSSQSRVSKQVASAKQAGQVKKGQTIYKIQILTSDTLPVLNCLKDIRMSIALLRKVFTSIHMARRQVSILSASCAGKLRKILKMLL